MIQWYSQFEPGVLVWVLLAAVLAYLLQGPGLMLFYCGLFKRDRSGEVATVWLGAVVLLSMVWFLWAYSLAFAPSLGTLPPLDLEPHPPDVSDLPPTFPAVDTRPDPSQDIGRGGVLGGAQFCFLKGMAPQAGTAQPVYPARRHAVHVPHTAFMFLHLTILLCAVAPLLVVLIPQLPPARLLAWSALWSTIVYAPLTHWIWGDGWLSELGALDSSGGLWHVGVGFSGLAIALGPGRRAAVHAASRPSAAPVAALVNYSTVLGAALAGTAALVVNSALVLMPEGRAAMALLNTHLAAVAGVCGWSLTIRLAGGDSRPATASAGAIAGLSAIASGCGLVAPQSALIIGLAAGVVARITFQLLSPASSKLEGLTILSVQGIPSFLGLLLTGLFTSSSAAGVDRHGTAIEGILGGNTRLLVVQLGAAVATAGLALVGTWLGLVLCQAGLAAPLQSRTSSG